MVFLTDLQVCFSVLSLLFSHRVRRSSCHNGAPIALSTGLQMAQTRRMLVDENVHSYAQRHPRYAAATTSLYCNGVPVTLQRRPRCAATTPPLHSNEALVMQQRRLRCAMSGPKATFSTSEPALWPCRNSAENAQPRCSRRILQIWTLVI